MFNAKLMRELRIKRGMNMMDLAVALHGLGQSRSLPTLRSWEKGKVQPRVNDVLAIAQALRVQFVVLMSPFTPNLKRT